MSALLVTNSSDECGFVRGLFKKITKEHVLVVPGSTIQEALQASKVSHDTIKYVVVSPNCHNYKQSIDHVRKMWPHRSLYANFDVINDDTFTVIRLISMMPNLAPGKLMPKKMVLDCSAQNCL